MTFVSKLKSYFYAILYFLLVFALQKDRLWSYKCEKATADVSLKKAPDLFQAIPDLFQAIVEKLDKPEKICFICKKQLSKVLFFYKEKQIINVSVEEKKELDKIFQRKIPHQFSPGYLQKIISSMFIAQGFWNCKTDSTIDKQNQLIVTITKGPRFIISDITIDEHSRRKSISQIFNTEKLVKHNFKNKEITPAFLESGRKKALIHLRKSGFWNAQVILEPKIKSQSESNIILGINILIKTGQRAKFGEINFTGNNLIKSELIQKQIPFKSGDFWDSNLLYKAKNNLESLRVFDNVQLLCGQTTQSVEAFSDTSKVPITIELTESLPRELKFGLGITSNQKHPDILNFRESLGFKAGINLSKKNLILPYDEGSLLLNFNLEKGAIRSEYNYGKLKNFPLEITLSTFIENQVPQKQDKNKTVLGTEINTKINNKINTDNKTHLVKKFEHRILSFSCNLTKKTPKGSSVALTMGWFATKIWDHKKTPLLDLKYAIASSQICLENLQGNWLNETGVILSAANKFMYSLDTKNQSLGKMQIFGTFFTPFTETFSIAYKAGVVIAYPLGNFIDDSVNLAALENSEYFSGPDALLINGVLRPSNKRNFLEHGSISDILKKNEKAVYAAFELRYLINNYTGLASFCNVKIAQNQKPQFLAGIGARFGAHLSGLLLDFGWDTGANGFFWRVSAGAF